MISAAMSCGSGRRWRDRLGIDYRAGYTSRGVLPAGAPEEAGSSLSAVMVFIGPKPSSAAPSRMIAINSSSVYSHISFLPIEPEWRSSVGASRQRARVLSQKICAVTLPPRAELKRKPRYLRIGFGLPEIELIPVVLAQCFGIDSDHARYVVRRNPVCRHRLDLLALGRIRLVCTAAH